MAHRHVWRIKERVYSGTFLVRCKVEGCGERLHWKEAERRLNAVECLSAQYAQLWSEHIVEQPPLYEMECAKALHAYAATLEGEDAG
jgi:chaperonin GroEL (HSP60 family)